MSRFFTDNNKTFGPVKHVLYVIDIIIQDARKCFLK